MPNFLQWGLEHLNRHMSNHTDHEAEIGTTQPGVKIDVTLVSVKPNPNTQGIKTNDPLYAILAVTSQLKAKKVELGRGIKIFVDGRTFEQVNTPLGMFNLEEQYKTRTVIVCKELC